MPAKIPLTIANNSTFSHRFTYKIDGSPVNLTGYTGKSQIRDLDGNLIADFEVTLGGVNGTIDLALDLDAAANMEDGQYDVLLTPSGSEPFCLIEGSVTKKRGITENAN